MPRLPKPLRSTPFFRETGSSSIVSGSNVGISGSNAYTAFVFFRTRTTSVQTILALGSQTGAVHTGVKLRVTGDGAIDCYITGLGSVPVSGLGALYKNWRSAFLKKAAGNSPYIIGYNGRPANGGGTGTHNFTDAPLYLGRNSSGTEGFEGQEAIAVVWDQEIADADLLLVHRTLGEHLKNLPKPKVYYRLDDNGATIKDYSGNGNHGTATGLRFIQGEVPGGVRAQVKYKDILKVPGLLHAYEADQGVTKDGSDRVSQLNDLTGNGAHLVQATGANQPLWVSSGINGNPALRITDAADEFLRTQASLLAGGTMAHTIFCVVKTESAGNSGFVGYFGVGSGVSSGNTSCLGHENGNKPWFGGAGYGVPTVNETISNGATYVMAKRCNGRQDTCFVNGKKVGSFSQLGPYNIAPAADIMVGRYTISAIGDDFLFSFGALFERELSDAEIHGVMNTLMEKYGGGTPETRAVSAAREPAYVEGSPSAQAVASITVNSYLNAGGPNAETVFTITDYTQLTGTEIDFLGMATLVEGVDFVAETSNEVTAQNIATAFDTLAEEPVTTVDVAEVTVSVPGSLNGSSFVFSASSGVTPTTATLTGGFDKTEIYVASWHASFNDQISIGASNDDCATNLAAEINGALAGTIDAVAVGNVVTLTATTPGSAGNAFVISTTGRDGGAIDPTALTIVDFAGGADGSSSSSRLTVS